MKYKGTPSDSSFFHRVKELKKFSHNHLPFESSWAPPKMLLHVLPRKFSFFGRYHFVSWNSITFRINPMMQFSEMYITCNTHLNFIAGAWIHVKQTTLFAILSFGRLFVLISRLNKLVLMFPRCERSVEYVWPQNTYIQWALQWAPS